jgi:predicted tellurium resistance membrane protein TerC
MKRLLEMIDRYPRLVIYPVLLFLIWVALHILVMHPILLAPTLLFTALAAVVFFAVVIIRMIIGLWRLVVYSGRRQRDQSRREQAAQ